MINEGWLEVETGISLHNKTDKMGGKSLDGQYAQCAGDRGEEMADYLSNNKYLRRFFGIVTIFCILIFLIACARNEAQVDGALERLPESGELVETEFQVESTTSAELVIVGRLVRIEDTLQCGIFHFGAVAEYTDLTVLRGTYPYETIFVTHGCPELKRSEYAEGSGDLEVFRTGDYHELHLTQQNVYDVSTYPTDLKDLSEGLYFSSVVNLYSD
jgi:hypothetical protein